SGLWSGGLAMGYVALAVDTLEVHIEAPKAGDVLEHFLRIVVQRAVVVLRMAQGERTVAAQIHAPDLDVRLTMVEVVLARQRLAKLPIAAVVVDGRNFELGLAFLVADCKKAEIAHQLGRQKLADETLVLEIAHRVVQRAEPIAAGKVGEPALVLLGGFLADAPQIREHRETQRIGIDAAVGAVAD